MRTTCGFLIAVLCLVLTSPSTHAQKKWNGVWTDPSDSTLPADFKFQGEYVGTVGDDQLGCQVIALGKQAFQAVLYPGGLPGAGWDGQHKILMDGRLDGDKVELTPTDGNHRYLAGDPKEFSATSTYPPPGQKPCRGSIEGDKLSAKFDDGPAFTLTRLTRTSPTLGKKPTENATVLFDGKSAEAWTGGRVDEQHGILNTDGNDLLTKQKFNNYRIHLEFMLPFRPDARGQGRGNSGFYQVDHYEVQILDSFGLDGKGNECGGIYGVAEPLVNMCYPPLTWQTYDIDFTNAVRDESGKKTKNSRITVRLNGVVIHQDLELPGKTGGSRGDPEGTPGPLKLQGHGNPLQYRNIWIEET